MSVSEVVLLETWCSYQSSSCSYHLSQYYVCMHVLFIGLISRLYVGVVCRSWYCVVICACHAWKWMVAEMHRAFPIPCTWVKGIITFAINSYLFTSTSLYSSQAGMYACECCHTSMCRCVVDLPVSMCTPHWLVVTVSLPVILLCTLLSPPTPIVFLFLFLSPCCALWLLTALLYPSPLSSLLSPSGSALRQRALPSYTRS